MPEKDRDVLNPRCTRKSLSDKHNWMIYVSVILMHSMYSHIYIVLGIKTQRFIIQAIKMFIVIIIMIIMIMIIITIVIINLHHRHRHHHHYCYLLTNTVTTIPSTIIVTTTVIIMNISLMPIHLSQAKSNIFCQKWLVIDHRWDNTGLNSWVLIWRMIYVLWYRIPITLCYNSCPSRYQSGYKFSHWETTL